MIEVEVGGDYAELTGLLPDDLLKVGAEIWDVPMLYLAQQMKEKVKTIRRKRVSKSTQKWRAWASRSGLKVLTFKDKVSGVMSGARAGMRTGTLLEQLENSAEPTVTKNIFHTPQRGMLVYAVDEYVYHNEYPIYFSAWLEKAKGVEGGIGITNDEQSAALKFLIEGVDNHLVRVWGRGQKRLLFPRIGRKKWWQ